MFEVSIVHQADKSPNNELAMASKLLHTSMTGIIYLVCGNCWGTQLFL